MNTINAHLVNIKSDRTVVSKPSSRLTLLTLNVSAISFLAIERLINVQFQDQLHT